jgi:exodeoxyribonuclease III
VAVLAKGRNCILTRKGASGELKDELSRYVETRRDCHRRALPPQRQSIPGQKFDYKLCWFRRLRDYAAELLPLEAPIVLAGDYNVMPTEMDVCKPE